MSEASPPIDRDEELLSELAELDIALARKVHAAAMAAEEPKAIADLGRTYQRIARSLRQTLALKGQLKRQREIEARPRPLTSSQESLRIQARFIRQTTLCDAVMRVAWSERESLGDELEDVRRDLHDLTEVLRRSDDPAFVTDDVDKQVEALCRDVGLPTLLAITWRTLPPCPGPPEEADEEDDDTS